jgi:hypothetical protein
MLSDALSFPRQDDDWLKTVLVGGLLTIFGFLLIPAIPVQGYLVRVLDAGVRDAETPPVFDEWGELFVDGILVFVIQLAYAIVPTVIIFFGTFVLGAGALAAGGGAEGAGAGIGLFGGLVLLVGFLLSLVAAYLIPAATANFAYEDDIGAAFDLGTIRAAAFTGDYLVAVVLAIVVAIVLGFVGGLLSVILVGFFVLFYLQVVVYFLFGRGFGEGLGIEAGDDDGDDRVRDPGPLT